MPPKIQTINKIGPVSVRIEYMYSDPISSKITRVLISKFTSENMGLAITNAQYICGGILHDDELIPYTIGRKYIVKTMSSMIGSTHLVARFKYTK